MKLIPFNAIYDNLWAFGALQMGLCCPYLDVKVSISAPFKMLDLLKFAVRSVIYTRGRYETREFVVKWLYFSEIWKRLLG